MSWLDLTPELTKKGQQRLKVGQVMMFTYEGSPLYIKIMRKYKDKVWGKQLDPDYFLTPEDADKYMWVVPKKVEK